LNHSVPLGLRRAFHGVAVALSLLAAGQAMAAVPPLSFSPNEVRAVDQLLADARKAIAAGNLRLALIYLKNATSADPKNTTARVELGKAFLLANDPTSAERELRQALKDGAPPSQTLPPLFQAMLARDESQLLLDLFPEPNSDRPAAADIMKARALALQKLKRGGEAIAAMDRSLALRRDAQGVLTRARLSLQQGDFGTAGRLVDSAIQEWPDDPDAMLFKAEMLLASRDSAGALNLASQMREKFPTNLPVQFMRVEAYLRLNQDAKARAEVEEILAKKPGLFVALYYKALLMARAGDSKAAWGLAQTLPGDFLDADQSMAAMVAQMALTAGDTETGAAMLARMLKNHPEAVAVRIRLAQLRLEQDSASTALNVLRPVQDSTDPRLLSLFSRIYLQMQRPREALDALRKLDAAGGGVAVKRAVALLELRAGNTDQAINDLTQAAAKEPANPSIAGPLISALMQKGRLAEALAAANRLGADPKQAVTALVYRGSILTLQRDFAGARAALDKAIVMDPRSKTALYSRATLFEAVQKYPEAGRDLRTILLIDNKDMAATMKLVDIAIRQGDDQNARKLLAQAIALSPRNVIPRVTLTRYLISRGDMKGALTAANGCLGVQTDNADCVLLLGRIQSTVGQKKEAAASFRRLVTLKPSDASARLALSAALALTGDRAGAGRSLDAAAELAPTSAAVKRAQINFQLGQGNSNAAIASARAFQAAHPGTESDLVLAETLQQAKQDDEAVSVLGKSFASHPNSFILIQLARLTSDKKRAGELMAGWLAKNPRDENVRMEYAGLLLQQGDSGRAISQYEMVVKRNPNNIDALNNLGWTIQRSDPKRALSLLTHARDLSPDSANVADTLGWLKLQQKDAAGGLALLDRAHALDPRNGQITYHLAVALDANAKRDAARGLLKSLLAGGASFRDRPAAVQQFAAWQ